MANDAGPVVVMNPRSGGGKVARFRLIERAQAMGAQVRLTGPGQDVASLARAAIAEGAALLGVAGGDGTVAAVAAVAIEAGRPLVVIPAGTRNHFARDLGLNIRNPVSALTALHAGDPVPVDLGQVGSRIFINNVSFGAYADALLTPGYREAKARTFAEIAPGYLQGEQRIDAVVDTAEGPIDGPQIVLVSNNPYDLDSLRRLGHRSALDTGRLGGIVVKHPDGTPPPDLFPRLRRELRQQGHSGPPGAGVHTWTAPRITLHSTAAHLPAGIDGEPVELDLPIVCEIRPGALQVLLPRRTT
ncbi:diacylglycerol kinase, catalytic region [Amycolatopsis mediterranei S699]|uniref:Diacylglycerol kinase, catalytic region n=4 Tax=Amycolatopsis mediterranei TaxID=33910 RepID=A0A0H3D7Z9_AMYMU|nr:diacylglycerol kinase family protein [Amycolatopsis mediterranei]AGT85959.1 diacylglycerol kinase, catalytic region [Amycolatopsis mediterranei RB]ADJ47120.1 diacylglycerol kinase, catalytic region [Amycolatopsis mediterranei U32]AEK43940.1 diacylglycerol kinase, catalytic region [Amycolatopsis mediterranei S699]AFO78831.1 diacylglycerol kinase, catalytic region [Amycolatopsis mediterranei S699]KDO04536.1 diacylglycerol kinase [Amycolatopsis mediterranei]